MQPQDPITPPTQPNPGVVPPQNPLPVDSQPLQQPGVQSGVLPQTPIQPTTTPVQPVAAPVQPNTGVMPPASTQPIAAPSPADLSKKRSIKKILVIVSAIIGGGVLLLFVAGVIIGLLGGGVPKYSQTKDVSLEGYSTDDSSGMSFKVPEEMQEKVKTDLSARFQHEAEEGDASKGSYGQIEANIETVSFLEDLNQEQINQIAEAFKSSEFDKEAVSESSFIKNISFSNKQTFDNNKKLRADLSFEIQSAEDSKTFKPGKGAYLIYVEGKRIYSLYYAFIEEVYSANTDFWKTLEDSVKVAQ